ncbi:Oxygen-dependent choline dehydrogenase [Madurella mycetomatis]|uniref:Oxygen-dependent choline dehydrogenase n=1 Tax=Madurella mycetomatis TaxID=100816 RepID=A0A175VYD0_9PEZI|nr:Oxygen-dependent choline dehydrogenase [Madurella mycetomatis]
MPYLQYDTSYWGNTSSVFTGWPYFQWPGTKYQYEAFSQLPGVENPEDSGAGKSGVFWHPTYMDAEGSVNRSYAKTGHWDGLNRANYDLITWSHVTKINLDGNKATGVVFRPNVEDLSDVKFTTVKARKEVIVSAGAIHSPQVLQLSGIGPKGLLESAGIETKVDLPGVGQNFVDHNFRNYTVRPNRRDDLNDPEFRAWADEVWAANRTGPWSRGLWNAAAWLPMPVIAPDTYESIARTVDAQRAEDYLPEGSHPTVIAGYQARLASLAKAIRSRNDIFYSHYFSGDEPVHYFTYEHPLSVGTVNINASSPESEPIVDFRTYSNPADFDIMIEMARFHRRVNEESPVLVPFDPVEVSPGRNVTSREDWIAYLRTNTEPTAMHPSGTCAMMPLELGGVVDEQLRVYGVEGLRVVDASVMPVIIGANICGAVYAIAEKAADLIKSANGQHE